MSIKDKALEYLKANLSIIPTKEDKSPCLQSWKPYQSKKIDIEEVEALFSGANVKGLGIICGAISGNLEVIDVDTKHDTTGSLWEELRGLIEDNLPELYSRLVIAQSKSGGYHIYYRCSSISGNLKLSTKLNREVLIETRGEGGYIVAPPTIGYKYIQGAPDNIPTITPENRDILLNISKSFNELDELKPPKVNTNYSPTGLTPFEDYNQRGDVVGLLVSKGWKVVNHNNQRINLLRAGNTDSKTSGNYHTALRVLRVFSSSTEFNPDKAYSPSMVFSLIECNSDQKLTYKRLLALGYGEPYNGEEVRPTRIKIEQIKIEGINKEKVVVVVNKGDTLKIETLEPSIIERIIITPTGSEATNEILKAIDLIQGIGKQIYIKEGASEFREYRYQLRAIFNKYGTIQDESGGLTDRAKDSLLDEVLILSSKLSPIDKDIFLKEFISLEPIRELGISEESLSITVDRLTSTREKEAQAKEFKKLLSDVTLLQDRGETDKAIELIESRAKDVKLKDKGSEFSKLMRPMKEEEIKQRQANKPESLNSGYTVDKEPLFLPSGALSIITAPTSHGKTTLLINLALNVATASPDKQVYYFSFEEDADSILYYTLNTYLNKDISLNNRESIKSYFATGSTDFIRSESRDYFTSTKNKFFSELIDTNRLNINYIQYSSDTLIEAIRHIHKHGKPNSIFIDYIQLLNLQEGKYKTYSRQEEIKEVCIALKDVAVETGLPIILGAQFNREVINQLRVHSTNIGEAGDIERIANLIIGSWNNNFKSTGTDRELKELNSIGGKIGTLYITILKNRVGRVGLEENLLFNGNTGKIENKPEPTDLLMPIKK